MSYKIIIWFKNFLKMYSTILEGKKGNFPHRGSKNKAFCERNTMDSISTWPLTFY